MKKFIQDCITYRELIYSLSRTYITARYKQTILGVGWALVPPVVLATTVFFVFPTAPNGISKDTYGIYLLVGFLCWQFFSNSVSYGVNSLVGQTALLRKTHFPKELLILSSLAPAVVDFFLGLLFFIGYLLCTGKALFFSTLYIFLLFLVLFVFSAGISLLGALLNVAFRDISKSLPIILQVLFFITPVIYTVQSIPPALAPYYKLNPLTGIIENMRTLATTGEVLHGIGLIYSTALSVILFVCAYYIFKKGEQVIVDII